MTAPMLKLNDIKLIKRGRPKGSLGSTGRIRYRPKKWLPEYNQLVVDYIIIPGITHKELGVKYGYTSVHICNILNTKEARDIQEAMAQGIVKYNQDNLPVKIAEMSNKIIQRLHDFMHDDNRYKENPFSFIDKSLSIGKAIGSLDKEKSYGDVRGATTNNTQINNISISGKDAKELADSLDLVKRLRVESGNT